MILCFATTVLSQLASFPSDYRYDLHASYSRIIKKDKVTGGNTLSEIVPGYPVNWISAYVSVEVSGTCNGIVQSSLGTDERLTEEQKAILAAADPGSAVTVDVSYRYIEPVTHETENNRMHFSLTLIPEKEAEFPGGPGELKKYLDRNGVHKLLNPFAKNGPPFPDKAKQTVIRFSVNEKGEVTDPRIWKTSGNAGADGQLLQIIGRMPRWEPAKDAKGKPVKQDFEFSIADGGGC